MALLNNIDNIREKATEAAQYAAKKTKKLAELAKANLSIYQEEDKIKKAQTELGKLYYRDYVVGEEMDTAEYLPWCQSIDEAKQTISDLRDYIDELKAEHVATEGEDVIVDVAEKPAEAPEAPAEKAPEMEIVVCDEAETPKAEDSEAPEASESSEAPKAEE